MALAKESPASPPTFSFPAVGSVTLAHVSVDVQTGALPLLLPTLLLALDLNYALAAGIVAANQIVIAIAQPLFGLLGDKKSFTWMVPVGLVLTGLGMATVLWMPSYSLVIVAVLLSGLGSAMFHPEALSRVRANSGAHLASGTSVFFAGGNIGFGLAPIVTALLLDKLGKPWVLLLLLPTVLSLVLLRLRWFEVRRRVVVKKVGGVAGRIRWGLVIFLMLLITLRGTVTGGLTTFLPLGRDVLNLTQDAAAALVTVVSLAGIAGTLAGGFVADRIGTKPLLVGSAAVLCAAMFLFGSTSGFGVHLALLGVVGLASSAAWPTIVLLIQDAMPGFTGLASGLSLGTVYAATGLGVAALGAYADRAGLPATLDLLTWLPIGVLLLTLFLPSRVGNVGDRP